MPDVVKLKKKAADFELKKQFEKALAVYVEILDGYDASDQEVDVSLFNRVGDLYLKQGSPCSGGSSACTTSRSGPIATCVRFPTGTVPGAARLHGPAANLVTSMI